MARMWMTLVVAVAWLGALAQPQDYSWTTMSRNSSESMPCGGGSIGLNVWVEQGDVLFYISRSGTYDEQNTLLKLGRVRVKLSEPITDDNFCQTLQLSRGCQQLTLGDVVMTIWTDVFKPIIHVEMESKARFTYEVDYENWRYRERLIRPNEGTQGSLKWSDYSGTMMAADVVDVTAQGVQFYHQNGAATVFDKTVEAEQLERVKPLLWNPLAHLTFGGELWGEGLQFVGTAEGIYSKTDYKAWRFVSAKTNKQHHFTIALHTEQTSDIATWQAGLAATKGAIRLERDRKATHQWWQQFWQRSFIEAAGEAAEIARNYTLFRYMLGCNAYGSEPTKFNGSLFTFDPVFVRKNKPFTPDYRNWGGGTMTAQNQRLVYWPMLKSGDVDMMQSEFNFYLRMLGNAELRSKVYWGHAGGCFAEQIEQFGLPNWVENGLNRPADADPGVEYNEWLEYTWDTVLEFCQMIIDSNSYAGADIESYTPLIESALTFFDEHYQYLASKRGACKLDGDGKLIIYPGSAGETFKMAHNPSSTIAALQTVLTSYIRLKEKRVVADTTATQWRQMLARIPAIPFTTTEGRSMIAAAQSWERINNVETMQLYPVFPWRLYGMASDDTAGNEAALNTYLYDPWALKMRSSMGWKQDNIWAACLGQTYDAARLAKEKMGNGPHRFPAFWGPGFDWTPDHNHGGSGMIGMQEMLLQATEDKIVLFPAWPREWDVHFKLHAPGGVTVEATLEAGKVTQVKVSPEGATVVCP